jgi:Membrane domain of glycerophosphoryl diester phosphodiesterase
MEAQALPTLRPLRLGELLDRAIRLYRGNFLTFIGIIAVVYVPLMVLQTAASALLSSSMVSSFSTPEEIFSNSAYWIGILATIVLGLVQFVLVQGIATGALTRAVADNYLGKKTSILDAYRGIGKSWLTLIGALIFLALILLALAIWFLVPCIGWLTGLGMFLFMSMAVNPLVPPVVVLENQGVIDAVRRAWSLARRRFWPVLGYVVVLAIFSLIVVNGPAAIINILLVQLLPPLGDTTMQLVLTSIIQGLVSLVFVLIYYPLQMAAFTLIYFDLRVRTEGFDLALLTMEASGSTDLAETMAAPVSQENERLITGPELANFAILTLAGAGLYIFFVSFIAGGMYLFTSLLR